LLEEKRRRSCSTWHGPRSSKGALAGREEEEILLYLARSAIHMDSALPEWRSYVSIKGV